MGCTNTAGESKSEAAFSSAWIKSSIENIDLRKWQFNLVSENYRALTKGSVGFFLKKRSQNDTYPSDYFALLVHANVMFALLSFYSDVAPKGFRLDNEKSWK